MNDLAIVLEEYTIHHFQMCRRYPIDEKMVLERQKAIFQDRNPV